MGKRSRAKERAGQSVKERRAAAKSSGMSMKQYKSGAKAPSSSKSSGSTNKGSSSSSNKGGGGGSSTPKFTNAQMAGKGSGGGLVKARRDAQQASGLSMKDYRAGVSGGTITKHGKAIPNNSKSSSTSGTTGYKAGHSAENTTAYGQTMGEFTSLDDYKNSNWAALNPNIDQYKQGGERMSSEGLYQDRYNVGYHSDDDLGDEYASTAFQGSVNKTFDKFRKGEQNFFQAYQQYVGSGRDEGYAGDVLKLIDSGKLKVSDDQYNMVVTDAQNYDWDKRGEIAGRDSGDSYYDSRAGGRAGNQTDEAQQEYMKSIGHPAAGGFQNDYDQGTSNQYQQNQSQQQNNMNYDFSQFMPSQRQGQKFQSYQGYSGPTSFGAGMKFSFDPSKFMQGQ